MSLSEYLALCKRAGMRPLVGVNYNCKGRFEDWPECALNVSIARAVRQVQFAVQRNATGAFWYIGK